MLRTFLDQKRQPHSLNLETVRVDGERCMSVQATTHEIQLELETQCVVTCELGQFWREVAGPDLSASEAGLLLAECLMRQVIIQRTSSALHEALCLLTGAAALPAEIPSSTWLTTRLDPLARQAMTAYDGSDLVTETIARIVQQSPATIRAWAEQLGLDTPPAHREETAPTRSPVTGPLVATPPTEAAQTCQKPFHWTSERCQQLRQELATCTGSTVIECARQIAARHHWPEASVRSKLYELQRPPRSGIPTAREPEQAETPQEEDRHADQREVATV